MPLQNQLLKVAVGLEPLVIWSPSPPKQNTTQFVTSPPHGHGPAEPTKFLKASGHGIHPMRTRSIQILKMDLLVRSPTSIPLVSQTIPDHT